MLTSHRRYTPIIIILNYYYWKYFSERKVCKNILKIDEINKSLNT
jgi:hypothetical protein